MVASKTCACPSDSGSLRRRLNVTAALGLRNRWSLGPLHRGRGSVY